MKRLRESRPALDNYRRSLRLLEGITAENPKNNSARNQILVAEGGLSNLLAILGDRSGSLQEIAKMIRAARAQDASSSAPPQKAYLPKALGWAGDTYGALARASESGKSRASDWRMALSYYRRRRKLGRKSRIRTPNLTSGLTGKPNSCWSRSISSNLKPS